MVAPNVPRLGMSPKLCLARPMLSAALDCYDKGDYIGAGVRLREAVKRFIVAGCEWYGIDSPKSKHPKPADYIRALRKAKQLDDWGAKCLTEMIDSGNVAAHCGPVDRDALRGGIALLFRFLDAEPFCPNERKPAATSHKSDVDDCANWWKKGGAP